MHGLLYKLFHPLKINPPKAVRQSFILHFGNSKNIEWHLEKGVYEAIFYVDEIEHIALFSHEGEIIEQKRNLLLSDASPAIIEQARSIGELMNLIEIERNGSTFFEVIARDASLDRYSLLMQEDGKILEKRIL